MGVGGAQQETGFCKVRGNLRKEEDRQTLVAWAPEGSSFGL